MAERRAIVDWSWVTAQFLLLAGWTLGIIYDRPSATPFPLSIILTIVGFGIATVGLATAVLALRRMRFRVTPVPEPRIGATLLTDGIYGTVRHPMYGGILLMTSGISLAERSIAGGVLTIVLGIFFCAKSSYEEQRLRKRFPTYEAYAHRTHRFFPMP